MSEKIISARVIPRNETVSDWEKSSYVPKTGEIISVNTDEGKKVNNPALKIGNGKTSVKELPYVGLDVGLVAQYNSNALESLFTGYAEGYYYLKLYSIPVKSDGYTTEYYVIDEKGELTTDKRNSISVNGLCYLDKTTNELYCYDAGCVLDNELNLLYSNELDVTNAEYAAKKDNYVKKLTLNKNNYFFSKDNVVANFISKQPADVDLTKENKEDTLESYLNNNHLDPLKAVFYDDNEESPTYKKYVIQANLPNYWTSTKSEAERANEAKIRKQADDLLRGTEKSSTVDEKSIWGNRKALNKEINERKQADNKLYGTDGDEDLPESLDYTIKGNNELIEQEIQDRAQADTALQKEFNEKISGLKIDITKEDGKEYIVIKDKGDEVITQVDAKSFIVDGMLQEVIEDHENNTIIFTWNVDGGSKSTTIDIDNLVETYTGENGINVSGFKITAVRDDTSEDYLEITDKGIKVTGINDALKGVKNRIDYGDTLPETGEEGDVFLLQDSTSSDKILSISEMTYRESDSQVVQFTDAKVIYNESSGIMKICCQCDSQIQADEEHYINIVLNNIDIGRKLMGGIIYYDKSSCFAISNNNDDVSNSISILSSNSIEADVTLNIVLYFI